MMMNWKELGRNRSWPNFKVLSRHSTGGTEEGDENPQSRYPVAGADILTRDLPNTKQEY
jgi:hypothetical protein